MMNNFRAGFGNAFRFNWQLGLGLILLFGIPRFILVLEASRTGNYNFTALIFILMMITPFILLSKSGRGLIGIKRPENYPWLFYSIIIGFFGGAVTYYLGDWLYQDSINHWFVYISKSYTLPHYQLSPADRAIYFAIFALIGITFSPFGEELLYRGIIHQSFVSKFSHRGASVIDSLAFALTHLAHFGIIYVSGVYRFVAMPAILWMLLVFLLSRLFFYCKTRTGSILGAVLCHAGFNFAMTYFIFYYIL